MAFPTTPTDNQTATVNGISYIYSSAKNAWTRNTNTVASDVNFRGVLLANTITTTGNITANTVFTNGNISYTGNALMPKTYVDALSVVFGF